MFPSIKEIAAAVENRFVVEDWHNFGADYAPTLRACTKISRRAGLGGRPNMASGSIACGCSIC